MMEGNYNSNTAQASSNPSCGLLEHSRSPDRTSANYFEKCV